MGKFRVLTYQTSNVGGFFKFDIISERVKCSTEIRRIRYVLFQKYIRRKNWKSWEMLVLKSIYEIINSIFTLSFPRSLISNPELCTFTNKIPRLPISPSESKPSNYVRQTKSSPWPNESKPSHSRSLDGDQCPKWIPASTYIVHSIQVYSRKLVKSFVDPLKSYAKPRDQSAHVHACIDRTALITKSQ